MTRGQLDASRRSGRCAAILLLLLWFTDYTSAKDDDLNFDVSDRNIRGAQDGRLLNDFASFANYIVCRLVITASRNPSQSVVSGVCTPINVATKKEQPDRSATVNIPSDFFQQYRTSVESGRAIVLIYGATLSRHEVVLDPFAEFVYLGLSSSKPSSSTTPSSPAPAPQLQPAPTGASSEKALVFSDFSTPKTLKFLILRVSTPDSVVAVSLDQVKGALTSDQVNFRTQYQACSFGKTNIVPADYGDNGVMDVLLNSSISSYPSATAVSLAAESIAAQQYGMSSITELADKVIVCIPPGTGDWVGTSALNYYRSLLNNEFCTSLSASMHEIGHLFGLIHSGQGGDKYADSTGYMGYSRVDATYPRRCFNGFDNWMLRWYSDRHLYMDKTSKGRLVKLATFVHYGNTEENVHFVVINLSNLYYIQYNYQGGFNADTGEMGNQVTVTQDSTAQEGISNLLKGLGVGDSWMSEDMITVKVCSNEAGTPDVMVLSIGLNPPPCQSSDNNQSAGRLQQLINRIRTVLGRAGTIVH